MQNVLVVGASGALGRAFVQQLGKASDVACVYALSTQPLSFDDARVQPIHLSGYDEAAIQAAAAQVSHNGLDCIVVATGVLHDGEIMPEKSLREVNAAHMQHIFMANTVFPLLVAKYFLPKLCTKNKAVMAFLSARVGSISDNRLGGWYAYRASKAALNMVVKNIAIEHGRFHKNSVIVGLHPGTVDTKLSSPFHQNISPDKIFTPDYSVERLLALVADLDPSDSGRCYAWDGAEIAP